MAIAKKYKLKIIEDVAHGFGNQYQGRYLGSFGEAALFSLYKLFPTLRGGLAVLPPTSQAVILKKTKFSWRDFASLLNCLSVFSFLFKKYGSEIAQKHIRQEKLKEPSALNSVSLNIFAWHFFNHLDKTLLKRKQLALLLQTELKKMGFGLQSPKNNSFTFLSGLVPAWLNRNELVRSLRKEGVFATRIWHTPIILNKQAQKNYHLNPADFPQTVKIASQIINFPLQNFYTQKDIAKIIEKVKQASLVSFYHDRGRMKQGG